MKYAKVIAIDGPSASGKSTIGRRLARYLGYLFVDSGLFYRVVAFEAIKRNIPVDDVDALAEYAETMDLVYDHDLRKGKSITMLDGEPTSKELYRPNVDLVVPLIAAHEAVRVAVRKRQHALAASEGSIVMSGRDVGSVVLPDADRKFFLELSAEERAHRRFTNWQINKLPGTYEDALIDILLRDQLDRTRAVSPMLPAEDAKILHTHGMDLTLSYLMVLHFVEIREPGDFELREMPPKKQAVSEAQPENEVGE